MVNAEETRRIKARELRYRKPIVKNLNISTISEEIWDIQGECENVHWYFEGDDDTLINALDGDEDEVYEQDYFGLQCADTYAEQEAAKKLKQLTKDDFIQGAQQCFKVYHSYIGLRHRYDCIKASMDILRDQNTGYLQMVKQIEEIYEKANADNFYEYNKPTRDLIRFGNSLPQEAWIA